MRARCSRMARPAPIAWARRLRMTGGPATGLSLNLEGTRQDPVGQQPVNQGLRLQAEWSF